MAQLNGQVAVVTGDGSGIGRSTCECYAHEGAKVMVSDIDESNGNEVVRAIKDSGGEVLLCVQMFRVRKTASYCVVRLR